MKLKIESLDPTTIGRVHYDLILVCIGYEKRARYFVEAKTPEGKSKFALGFDIQKVLSYNKNLNHFQSAGYGCSVVSFAEFSEQSRHLIREAVGRTSSDADPRIIVDITSLSRARIAVLVEALAEEGRQRPVNADFVYSPAKYSAPGKQPDLITTCKPVSDYFAGWSNKPEQPLAAFVGLGYEIEKAIGVLEYLEPGWIWVFFPTGTDKRYEKAVESANSTLLTELNRNRRINYLVPRPLDCYTILNTLVSKVKETARPILIPLGPKIFSLISMLVSLANSPEASVWRVSAGEHQAAKQRRATGELVGVAVRFGEDDRN